MLFLFLVVLLVIAVPCNAEMMMNVGHEVFVRDTNKAVVEFYYSYPETAYSLQNIEGKIGRGNIQFDVAIEQGNNVVEQLNWQAPFEKYFSDNDPLKDFYGIQRCELKPGKYKVKFSARDLNNNDNYYSSTFKLNVGSFNKDHIFIGGMQMANNIVFQSENAQHPGIFSKNGYYVYPNPAMEISSEYPTLYLYSEIYNAKKFSPKGIEIVYSIFDARNRLELDYKKTRNVLNDAFVETISIPLDVVESGVYFAEIKVYNSDKTDSASKKLKFFLVNNNVELSKKTIYTEDEMFEMSEFATYTEERANDEFEKFSIVASNLELKSWKRLTDLKAKQRFLYRFWFVRNTDQKSGYNKELQTFRDRVKYVNTYFSWGGKQNGWKTDRGKVYIKFGEPDQMDKNSATPSKHAYDVWYYTGIDGGGEFYFIDMHGMGVYNLIHSTAFGYIHNDNWYEMVTGVTDTEKY
ncbi:MAG: GWxTD domain-containing protein [Bacteroidetes bacterium]|nr:GWxTD domain-containing protein [Bacteroidota bacterium]